MMRAKEVNVVFATDEGYVKQTYIAMQSVIESGKCYNKYIFWIMFEQQKKDLRDYFKSIEENYANCEINYVETGDYFGNAHLPIAHITKPTYYRLLIPSLLNLDRCIYLDADVIVCDDLEELYTVSLEGYEVAGVLAASYRKDYGQCINIPSMDTYINAGVLLMNLDEMRKNDFTKNAVIMSEKGYPSSDQDVINILSYGKIKLLPLSYNYQAGYVGKIDFKEIFDEKDIVEAEENPRVIHYLTPQKPWEFLHIKYAERWWEACHRTPYFEDFFERYHKIFYHYGIITKHGLWWEQQGTDLWYTMLKKFSSIYLYGAGAYAKKIIEIFIKREIPIKSIYVTSMEDNPCVLGEIEVKCFSGTVNVGGIVLIATSPNVALQLYREFLDRDFYNFYLLNYDKILNDKYERTTNIVKK